MSGPQPLGASFRDPAARVYADGERILRGLCANSVEDLGSLQQARFFAEALRARRVVDSTVLEATDPAAAHILRDGWAGVVEHERVPFLSYPYEWTFSMLRDAALLHLELLEAALGEGWVIKDSTPYNIQFWGAAPVFIDVPSFTRRVAGDYWRSYRQFCMAFLYPLLISAHRGIPFQGSLRSSLDGIEPGEAARHFTGLAALHRGVLTHVRLPAALERWAAANPARAKTAAGAPRAQSDPMVVGLVQSMKRIVRSLRSPSPGSAWSEYATTHSYDAASFEQKQAFVAESVARASVATAWDLGANTGAFSEILAGAAGRVVAVDSDHASVERLYLRLRERGERRILPLTMDLANPSPDQGWAGIERLAFHRRNRPDLIVALALVHHICLGHNVPIPHLLDWLAGTGARLVIEFVDRDDEMAAQMLSRKAEKHEDYNRQAFERELGRRYELQRSTAMKGGRRVLYDCTPRG